MTTFALAAQIRNVLLCTLVTMTLAACGGESGSSSAAATSAATSDEAASNQLVSSGVGTIDRSQGIGENDGASSAATASNTTSTAGNTSATTASSTAATTPAAGSGSSVTGTVGSGATTVNGVATLDWMPPTQNSDGSVLTNLAGYTVYYGTSENDLSQSVKVSNPGLAAYTVTGLTSGTWYFAMTSYSADGNESIRTSTVTTHI